MHKNSLKDKTEATDKNWEKITIFVIPHNLDPKYQLIEVLLLVYCVLREGDEIVLYSGQK